MNLAIGPSPTTTIGRLLAGVLLLFAMLASSGAVADLLAASPAQTSQGGSAPLEKKAEVEEHYLAQFRAAPLSIAQAIAVAEGLHPGSRTVAAVFELSDRPGYRVRTVKDKKIWENFVDVITARSTGLETSLSMGNLETDERDNITALRSVDQELADAIAIAETAATGKAVSGGLVKQDDQVTFVVVVLTEDRVKEVFLKPPRSGSRSTTSHRNGGG